MPVICPLFQGNRILIGSRNEDPSPTIRKTLINSLGKPSKAQARTMRLLTRGDDGKLGFTKDLHGDQIPRYAILSHTWGKATEEVTHQDVIDGSAATLVGYQKIKFCVEQAERDGLDHTWIDSCCIDKTNSAELSEAINSMFYWYKSAEKCYAYLADVPRRTLDEKEEAGDLWQDKLRRSRWFTRGWTLQELLAPAAVEFFSNDWTKIGDRSTLERLISDVTHIPAAAIRQTKPLADFSTAERMMWQESRQTTRPEDLAYSLVGICGVSLPVLYGEGKDLAFRRLRIEIENVSKGTAHHDFSITFGLGKALGVENFVARESELGEMQRSLRSNGSRRTVVLHGLGGIGKTQLAIAYAKRHRDDYSAIFWINADDNNSLKSGFANLARLILNEHPSAQHVARIGADIDTDQLAVHAVRLWLSIRNNTRWLLIFDNLDNPKVPGNSDSDAVDIRTFLPEADQGSIIITSRSSQLDIGSRLQLTKLSDLQDSLLMLANSSRRENIFSDPDATKLAEKLDGLPLALATAGAYLDQSSMTFADYLKWYEDAWDRLHEASPGPLSYEDRTLYSTWQVSFDQVEKRNHLSANLLRLWAYFDNQDLWYELLNPIKADHKVPCPEWISKLTTDELQFHSAVKVLCQHGLVESHTQTGAQVESRGYSIHTCLHSWTRTVLNPENDKIYAEFAIECVAAHVPKSDGWLMPKRLWTLSRRLAGHAAHCQRKLPEIACPAWCLIRLGNAYWRISDLTNAEKLYLHSQCEVERVGGDVHNSLHNLGLVYKARRRWAEAEHSFQRALSLRENTLGLDHSSTLSTVFKLGELFKAMGRYDQAETMLHRAHQGLEKTLGSSHVHTLRVLRGLSDLFRHQERHDEAEMMLRRALRACEDAFGQDHPETMHVVIRLSYVVSGQKRYKEEEEMAERALRAYETAFGPDDENTLRAVYKLGDCYRVQKRFDEAEEMLLRALRGYEKVYGPNHEETLMDPVDELSKLRVNQKRFREAETLLSSALKGFEMRYGPDNKMVLFRVNELGYVLLQQGKYKEAEPFLLRGLHGYERVHGQDAVTTLEVPLNNLGLVYAAQGKVDQAETIYQRALCSRHMVSEDAQAEIDAIGQEIRRLRNGDTHLPSALAGVIQAIKINGCSETNGLFRDPVTEEGHTAGCSRSNEKERPNIPDVPEKPSFEIRNIHNTASRIPRPVGKTPPKILSQNSIYDEKK